MTQLLFQDALLNCFDSNMKYCLENNILFRILLILINAHGHPHFIGNLHPNIKVVFPPPHTSLTQSMGQGFKATFKVCYLRKTFVEATAATE
jgi:hypothetical protein